MTLCLMTIHAHPDDEASKGAATVARYSAEGVKTVLVCATGGEAGEVLNPAMNRQEVLENLAQVRREELEKAAKIIGFTDVCMLGYRDSGMPDSEHNSHPDCFARADPMEATRRLVALIREHRPQVLITYGDDQKYYPHPDHLQVHTVSLSAFDACGDANRYPETGEPWTVSKLYYSTWSVARFKATHEKFLELGLESPYNTDWLDREFQDHRITTTISVAGYTDVTREALLAHATQVDPSSPFWFGLPPEHARTVYPHDDFILARSKVEAKPPEDDLFTGVCEGDVERQS